MDSKQRAYLKSLSNTLKASFQVGKIGTNDNQIKGISDYLEANELIKITVLNNTTDSINKIATNISNQTQSQIVCIIGNKIVLYRKSENNTKIEL